MQLSKLIFKRTLTCLFVFGVMLTFSEAFSKPPKIVSQNMKMQLPKGKSVFSEKLLPGEIAGTKIEHVALVGPIVQTISLSPKNVDMFIFIKGNGTLKADTKSFDLVPESIVIPMTYKSISIDVPAGEILHFVKFTKKLSKQDKLDLAGFPAENKYDVYYTKFSDCEPYTEKIKSPNTVSRTVLRGDIIPRVALGTVQAPGPDRVGAHTHAMLDQLFLGLTDNDITVHADGAAAGFKEYTLLHIPKGSSHGASVGENKTMYYLWMDFFVSKEGQEWLKTHKPISSDKNDY